MSVTIEKDMFINQRGGERNPNRFLYASPVKGGMTFLKLQSEFST